MSEFDALEQARNELPIFTGLRNEIRELRAKLAAEQSACEELHKREVENREEIAGLRALCEAVEKERGSLRDCDMAHKLEEWRQAYSAEALLRERFQTGYDEAVHGMAKAREERNAAQARVAELTALLRESLPFCESGELYRRIAAAIGDKP